MTLRNLRIFVTVYQTQSITKAAQQLNMTQPAVTRAIKEMESYYSVELFERINKRLYLTQLSDRVYAKALHIIDSFDSLENDLNDWDTTGIIRVGATATLGNYMLLGLISEYKKKYPDNEVNATISNGESLCNMLLNGELDIAFIENEVDSKELHSQVIGNDKLVLITPCGHELLKKDSVSSVDILNYPLLLREQGSTVRSFLESFYFTKGVTLSPVLESTSTQAIVRGVSCGLGISVLPQQLICEDILNSTVCTREISDETFERKHYIVWHKEKYLTASMKNFINLKYTSKIKL